MAVSEVKRQAREEPNTHSLHITQQVLTAVDSETLVALPQEKSLKRSIQRVRREHQPALPRSLDEFDELPIRYREINGDNFLLFDNFDTNPHNRIMNFGTRDSINQMAASQTWFGDGTFECVARIITQLYVLLYEVQNNVLVGCFVLMKNRTEASYTILFEALRALLPEERRQDTRLFSSNFEIATTNAFAVTFPESSERYCFFHFGQSLWRKAQATGIAEQYAREDNEDIRSQFHCCLALAFVPAEEVRDAFLDLREAADQQLDALLDHIEDYYVMGRRRGRGRQAPRFSIDSWNVYERTCQGQARTNNNCEAWNRRWKALVGKSHPNIYSMLEKMQKEMQYSDAQRELIELGNAPPRKKAKYAQNDERLKNLADTYRQVIAHTGDPNPWRNGHLRYLRAVGHSARGIFD